MNDTDLLKDLLETEQTAKHLVDEAQKKSDSFISRVKQEKQKEYDRRLEGGARERDKKIEAFKADLEAKKKKEIEEYRTVVHSTKIHGENAFVKLRELLKGL